MFALSLLGCFVFYLSLFSSNGDLLLMLVSFGIGSCFYSFLAGYLFLANNKRKSFTTGDDLLLMIFSFYITFMFSTPYR